MAIPTLTTERMILRPFTPEDLPRLTEVQAEESFWWYPLRAGMSADASASFLERMLGRYQTDGFGVEAVIERNSGDLIGWAGLAVPHFLPEVLPAVEVGWRLAGSHRGQGLATEIGGAAVEWAFTDGGLDRLVSIYEPENVASGKVMEHLGFTPWQTITSADGPTVMVTELTAETWRAHRG